MISLKQFRKVVMGENSASSRHATKMLGYKARHTFTGHMVCIKCNADQSRSSLLEALR